jgi:hypothetical protein
VGPPPHTAGRDSLLRSRPQRRPAQVVQRGRARFLPRALAEQLAERPPLLLSAPGLIATTLGAGERPENPVVSGGRARGRARQRGSAASAPQARGSRARPRRAGRSRTTSDPAATSGRATALPGRHRPGMQEFRWQAAMWSRFDGAHGVRPAARRAVPGRTVLPQFRDAGPPRTSLGTPAAPRARPVRPAAASPSASPP